MAAKQNDPKKKFDPNGASDPDGGVFGLPYSVDEARLVYVPVPWEVTTSYGGGTSDGPRAILDASRQVDLYDLELGNFWEAGLAMLEEPRVIRSKNREGKRLAAPIIAAGGDVKGNRKLEAALRKVNALGGELNAWVHEATRALLDAGRIPAVVGGDHSVPFGAFQAVGEVHGDFGILHFDAHSDTRRAFEGFEWSHASIMHNALTKLPAVKRLVQVGIRDFCEEELDFTRGQGERVRVFFDEHLAARKHAGDPWQHIADDIVAALPAQVWVSFDIDGLDPRFCPHTGTPVPGGLDFWEAVAVIKTLARSGRRIVGFDLNEVAPGPDDEWDGNVGARLLYKLSGWCLRSHGLATEVSAPTPVSATRTPSAKAARRR